MDGMQEHIVGGHRASPRDNADGVRGLIWVLTILTLLGLVFGIYWLREWLGYELRRKGPLYTVATLLAEGMAVWWFVHFFVTRCLLRQRSNGNPSGVRKVSRSWGWFVATSILAMVLDLCCTLWIWHLDKERFHSSQLGSATVARLESFKTGGIWRAYKTYCTYKNASGQQHRAIFKFKENTRKRQFKGGVPHELALRLRSRRTPFMMQIRYDPSWPNRSWVAGVEYSEQINRRPYVWSMVVLEVQLIGLMIAAAVMRKMKGKESTRNMLELARFFPLMSETFVLFFAGLISTYAFPP